MQNAATTGTAIDAGNPNRSARMNPAMASTEQSATKLVKHAFKLGRSALSIGAAKILIVSLAAILSDARAEMPADLIRSVARLGSKLVAERDHYTYTQTFKFYEIKNGVPAGRYEEIRDITFTGNGERVERHRKPPIMQLQRMRLTDEDFRDLRDVNPFVLTSETIRFYRVRYKGTEEVAGESCHVLQMRPRQILYEQRFFDGLLWISSAHGNVVRAAGRPVPQFHRIEDSNLFPGFETHYEPVDGEHWFPVKTLGDDILPFPSGNQRVRIRIEYSDYKRFTATSTVTFDSREGRLGDTEAPK